MTTAPHRRRRRGRTARRVLLLVALLLGISVTVGPAASAQIPGFDTDCKEAPEPEYPGTGFVGQLDTAPPSQTIPGSVYDEVGYAGLVWHTYDTGCIPNPGAPISTFVGNLLFDVAKVVVAATNGLHGIVTEGGFLDRFDDLVVDTSLTMYEGVFSPWFGLVGVLLGVLLFRSALTGDLAAAGTKLLYGAGALFLASATYLTPLLYTGLLDEIAVDGVNQLRSQVLDIAGIDEAQALPNTLHEQVVWRPWLQGEFGSADSPHATELGRDLAHAQAFTQAEVAAGQTGEEATAAKKERFEQVADRAGAAYPYLQGINDARIGAGVTALFKALIFAPFQLLTDAGLLLLQLLLRVIVMFGPVLGLVALLRGGVLLQTAMGIVGALLQALILAAAGCVHLIALIWITAPGRDMSPLFQMITMLLLTALLWKAVKPAERFRSIFNSAGGVVGLSGLNLSERYLRRLTKGQRSKRRRDLMGTAAWWFGSEDRDPPPNQERAEAQDDPATVTAHSQRMGSAGSISGQRRLGGGPLRPESDPGHGDGRATCTNCGTPIDGWFLCPRCQRWGPSGTAAATAARDEPADTVWATAERADRTHPGHRNRGVSAAPTTPAITRARAALPPGDPDGTPSRGDGGEPGAGQAPERPEPSDTELFIPPDHSGGTDSGRRTHPPHHKTVDDADWEIYRPDEDTRPSPGRRPEEETD